MPLRDHADSAPELRVTAAGGSVAGPGDETFVAAWRRDLQRLTAHLHGGARLTEEELDAIGRRCQRSSPLPWALGDGVITTGTGDLELWEHDRPARDPFWVQVVEARAAIPDLLARARERGPG